MMRSDLWYSLRTVLSPACPYLLIWIYGIEDLHCEAWSDMGGACDIWRLALVRMIPLG